MRKYDESARYKVCHCTQPESTAVRGLTGVGVIRYIYRDDGQDYSITPVMEDIEGRQEQWVDPVLGREWDVNFRDGRGNWRYGVLTAWGDDEGAADEAFCRDAFVNSRYDQSKWSVDLGV